MIEQFEHFGFHVEIHLNRVYSRYFWVTGTNAQRFLGACEYFDTVDACRNDAKCKLELLAKENLENPSLTLTLKAERVADGWFARVSHASVPVTEIPKVQGCTATAPYKEAAIAEVKRQLQAAGFRGTIIS